MGRKKEVRVGAWVFASQKEAQEMCSKLLAQYEVGQEVTDDVAVDFLHALISRHPEAETKIGCGVSSFYVDHDGFKGKCFHLLRTDGTRTDFSFRSCIKPPTAREEALSALRSEVCAQTQKVKADAFAAGVVHCAVTGGVLTWESAHVDHVVPFEQLVVAFLKSEQLVVESLKVRPTEDGATSTWLVDRGVAARWSEYHREHAVLRITSAEWNLRRPRST